MHGFNAQIDRMAQARAMRSGGASWGRIVAATGISMYLLKCEMVPGYREKERQKVIDLRAGMRRGVGVRRMVIASDESICRRIHASQVIPSEVIRERERAVTAPLTMGQIFFGDPLPGRSALDKKRKSEIERIFK